MRKNTVNLNFWAATIGILLCILSRLIPHPANFAPLMAVGIFGGAIFFEKKWAFLIPLLSIWLSDIFFSNVIYGQYYEEFMWFYPGWYWQYSIYFLTPLFSIILFRNEISLRKLIFLSLGSAVVFFLVSNFGVWFSGSLYPKTLEGLITCYVMGLPFLKGTVLSNVFYPAVLFGGYYLLENKTRLLDDSPKMEWKWT